MAQAQISEVYDVSIEDFYNVIVDYDSYPKFVDGVSSIKIIKSNANGAEVEYHLNLIKKFKYVLKLAHKRPTEVSWHLVEGDLFKKNEGKWTLEKMGEAKTKVTYSLDVDFKLLAPKMIINGLVSKNLPAMMKSYYQRVKEVSK